MDKDEKRSEWLPYALFLFAVVVFLFPFVIYTIAICNGMDSGNIGDTIGGSTAPIIGLISSVLLYFSFNSQVRANKIAREEANFKYLLDEHERVKVELNEFRYVEFTIANQFGNPPVATGIDGMINISENLFAAYNTVLPNLYIRFEEPCRDLLYYTKIYYNFLVEFTRLNDYQDKDYIRILETKVKLFFDENLSQFFDILINVDNTKDNIENNLRQLLIELKDYSERIGIIIGRFDNQDLIEL